MHLIIKQKTLIDKLNYIIRGIDNKNTLPILNCIKFELKEEGLYLYSTDNDKAIKTFIKSDVIDKIEETGDILIDGRLFYEYIRRFNEKDIISLIDVDNFLEISRKDDNNQTDTRIVCRNVDEYPNIVLNEAKNPIILSKKLFKTLLAQTLFATSTQESRPALTGLNIVIKDNILSANATDAYRLAKKQIEIENKIEENYNIIIPTRNLNELLKMLSDNETDIEMHIFDSRIIFKFDDILMMSNLINGKYPDIDSLIPIEYNTHIEIDASSFIKALDRVSLLSSEEDKNAVLLTIKDNIINLSSNNPETGKSTEQIPCLNEVTNEVRVAFSSKYMMDALKSLNGLRIELLYNEELKPIIVRNIDDDKLIHLILPVISYF